MFAMWRMFAKDKIIWDKVFNNGPICWSLTLQKPK